MPSPPLPHTFPYPTLFRSRRPVVPRPAASLRRRRPGPRRHGRRIRVDRTPPARPGRGPRRQPRRPAGRAAGGTGQPPHHQPEPDRKSTRLNSSHLGISYAVSTATSYIPLPDALPISTSGCPATCSKPSTAPTGPAPTWATNTCRPNTSCSPWPRASTSTAKTCWPRCRRYGAATASPARTRSEEHTSELQSLRHLVCRLHRYLIHSPTRRSSDLDVRLSRDLQQAFDGADRARADMGDEYVSTEHLLLALAEGLDVNREDLLAALQEVRGSHRITSQNQIGRAHV